METPRVISTRPCRSSVSVSLIPLCDPLWWRRVRPAQAYKNPGNQRAAGFTEAPQARKHLNKKVSACFKCVSCELGNIVLTWSSRSLRMAPQTSNLWMLVLLVVVMMMSQGCCQHWSYGLSPGGKRDLDSLSDTLGNVSIFISKSLKSHFISGSEKGAGARAC